MPSHICMRMRRMSPPNGMRRQAVEYVRHRAGGRAARVPCQLRADGSSWSEVEETAGSGRRAPTFSASGENGSTALRKLLTARGGSPPPRKQPAHASKPAADGPNNRSNSSRLSPSRVSRAETRIEAAAGPLVREWKNRLALRSGAAPGGVSRLLKHLRYSTSADEALDQLRLKPVHAFRHRDLRDLIKICAALPHGRTAFLHFATIFCDRFGAEASLSALCTLLHAAERAGVAPAHPLRRRACRLAAERCAAAAPGTLHDAGVLLSYGCWTAADAPTLAAVLLGVAPFFQQKTPDFRATLLFLRGVNRGPALILPTGAPAADPPDAPATADFPLQLADFPAENRSTNRSKNRSKNRPNALSSHTSNCRPDDSDRWRDSPVERCRGAALPWSSGRRTNNFDAGSINASSDNSSESRARALGTLEPLLHNARQAALGAAVRCSTEAGARLPAADVAMLLGMFAADLFERPDGESRVRLSRLMARLRGEDALTPEACLGGTRGAARLLHFFPEDAAQLMQHCTQFFYALDLDQCLDLWADLGREGGKGSAFAAARAMLVAEGRLVKQLLGLLRAGGAANSAAAPDGSASAAVAERVSALLCARTAGVLPVHQQVCREMHAQLVGGKGLRTGAGEVRAAARAANVRLPDSPVPSSAANCIPQSSGLQQSGLHTSGGCVLEENFFNLLLSSRPAVSAADAYLAAAQGGAAAADPWGPQCRAELTRSAARMSLFLCEAPDLRRSHRASAGEPRSNASCGLGNDDSYDPHEQRSFDTVAGDVFLVKEFSPDLMHARGPGSAALLRLLAEVGNVDCSRPPRVLFGVFLRNAFDNAWDWGAADGAGPPDSSIAVSQLPPEFRELGAPFFLTVWDIEFAAAIVDGRQREWGNRVLRRGLRLAETSAGTRKVAS